MPREWLWKLRKEAKLKQADVAAQAGISIPTYSAYESGNRTPTPKSAKRLAKVLGFEWTRFYE